MTISKTNKIDKVVLKKKSNCFGMIVTKQITRLLLEKVANLTCILTACS